LGVEIAACHSSFLTYLFVSVCVFGSTYKPSDEQCMDRRLWPTQKSFDERGKHLYYCQQHNNPVSQQLSYLLTYPHLIALETARLLMKNATE